MEIHGGHFLHVLIEHDYWFEDLLCLAGFVLIVVA
jgi:hypothetical protein